MLNMQWAMSGEPGLYVVMHINDEKAFCHNYCPHLLVWVLIQTVQIIKECFLVFVFFNRFLLGQGIYRSKYNISKGKTKLYNEYSITLN